MKTVSFGAFTFYKFVTKDIIKSLKYSQKINDDNWNLDDYKYPSALAVKFNKSFKR